MDKIGYVYVLYLENNCYYIGFSAKENIQTRICSHFLGAGSKFTQLNKPLDIIDVKPGDLMLENLTTLAYMCKYGFEKVRGGNYTNIIMKEPICLKKAKHYSAFNK